MLVQALQPKLEPALTLMLELVLLPMLERVLQPKLRRVSQPELGQAMLPKLELALQQAAKQVQLQLEIDLGLQVKELGSELDSMAGTYLASACDSKMVLRLHQPYLGYLFELKPDFSLVLRHQRLVQLLHRG